ncbi:alpha/beta hydrolase [Neolewinella aurantiaca]|uniref:Alpha/beta hydrolase n=1 Tax=Neolewinella aurantiaca TaxID=2602767 RepID=A0A5C7FIK9_9BACT|nr:alpha/beta hydrolase [Neolewinella aurantiaca]TXF89679.1 alpha/beta hydrolase [Neolewinella aurantiaca]
MNYRKLHSVTVSGSGERTMLMSHGFGCGQAMFRYLVAAFSPHYRVITYDIAGMGNYPIECFSRASHQDLNGYAKDVIGICEELGLSDVIHIGHSVSAMIAGLASIQRPDLFSQLVMIGPSACYINDGDYYGGFTREDIEELLEVLGENYISWSKSMAPSIMGNAEQPALGEELTASFCSMNPEIASFFARVTFTADNREDLSRITTPTLILQTEEDIIAPRQVGEYIHKHISGSKFVLLDARGHCPNISAPEVTIAAIKSYLEHG